MKIKISKKEIKRMIEEYYKEQLNFKGTVTMEVRKENVGFYEEEEAVLKTKIKGTMKFLGKDMKVEQEVPKEVIDNAIKFYLEKEGYDCIHIEFDYGIKEKSTGSYMNEHTEYKPYFKGVNIELNERVKKIGGINNGKY